MADRELAERLEMTLVMRWLDGGADHTGEFELDLTDIATDLGLDGGRESILALMGALGELEERGVARVAWAAGRPGCGTVELSAPVRADARRVFGRP